MSGSHFPISFTLTVKLTPIVQSLPGESAEEATQERQRDHSGAAGEGGGRGPGSGDAAGSRCGRLREAAAEAGARAGGVEEAAAVARRAHEALGDCRRGQGGRVARGQGRGAAGAWVLKFNLSSLGKWIHLHLISVIN